MGLFKYNPKSSIDTVGWMVSVKSNHKLLTQLIVIFTEPVNTAHNFSCGYQLANTH